jgi:hypothetical protein
MLGIEGYKEIKVEFKWADSETSYDEMEDFYCDGDIAPLGRLNYVYQNYIPGVSEITYPEKETEPETEAPTEPETQAPATEAPTDAPVTEAPTDGETEEGKKGCGSSVTFGAVILTALCAAFLIRRKED